MKSLTASAHLEPDSTSRVSVFDATGDDEPFVTLRIGGKLVDVALIAQPGTADALRALARAAEEAASALDQITDTTTDGDA
ncbi:hypothetical protein H1R13_13830 [Streptomyces mexicanus]|uniref:Uncharacterized protein n=1 Tax=Streptomyces mexicanus TaxID=178566 RepID=A0A7X1HZF6_9ACTN|nr:hypothetical protein [Streptomyces mexicanus]MBC2866029.1 hypothetical protein [Streptomyces mexicanus]